MSSESSAVRDALGTGDEERCGLRKWGAHLTTLSVNQRGRVQPRSLRFGSAITRTSTIMLSAIELGKRS